PLIDIGGEPLIVHVWRRALSAGSGRVVVATDTEEIIAAVRNVGGEAVLTRPDHASGSDRVFEAANRIDPEGDFEIILNVQGAPPAMEPGIIHACLGPLEDKGAQIATIAATITAPESRTDPNTVKVVGTPTGVPGRLRALYFTRATAPWGDGPLYHHFGMYAYRRSALQRFVSLRPSTLERRGPPWRPPPPAGRPGHACAAPGTPPRAGNTSPP